MSDVRFPEMSATPGATGVVVTWFVDSGDEVTPTTLIAEVAMDKVDAEVYPETSGTISMMIEEGTVVAQGTVIAQVT
ncbi:biotin attachment protein [Cryobacterium sp. MLB-32]|uniref:biotin/lipoyl-containing protein n=1 Tax=Cryobacterium sp. MLB-32 TaxID=1529318 RepID=UPI0004E65D22|nr:biotin/lipoyl-containing protein [Cryobacterium sp. MLB-32]KFF59815.1 biotin attachment protein [Cryobacterium sp. MLB-32]